MREKLLKTGMGCFVFASGVGVANTLLLPYAARISATPFGEHGPLMPRRFCCFAWPGAPFPSWKMKKPRVLRA